MTASFRTLNSWKFFLKMTHLKADLAKLPNHLQFKVAFLKLHPRVQCIVTESLNQISAVKLIRETLVYCFQWKTHLTNTVVSEKKGTFICELIVERYILA